MSKLRAIVGNRYVVITLCIVLREVAHVWLRNELKDSDSWRAIEEHIAILREETGKVIALYKEV